MLTFAGARAISSIDQSVSTGARLALSAAVGAVGLSCVTLLLAAILNWETDSDSLLASDFSKCPAAVDCSTMHALLDRMTDYNAALGMAHHLPQ